MKKRFKRYHVKVNLKRGYVEVRPSAWLGTAERNLGIKLSKISGPAHITRIKVEYTRMNPRAKCLERGIVEIRPTYFQNGIWKKLQKRTALLIMLGAKPKRVRVEYTIKKDK